MVKFLDLNKQYQSIKNEIDHAIKVVVDDSSFVGGKYPMMFEDSFASYIGANHCIGVANGTDALEIAIEALDLSDGSEIIVPANSFIASSEAITRSGKKVRFCDQDENYTISVEDIKNQINSKTSAIMVVHLYGHPADMDPIIELAKAHNLKIIEDCAQAHGALYIGRKVGTFGDIAAFSFYPGKNLGAYGDGGAIVTNNDELANKCRLISNHGSARKYEHDFEGRNSRLDSIQASILNAKLYHLDKWNAIRNTAAGFYNEYLTGVGDLILPKVENWANSVFHLYVIRTEKRDELSKYLNENDIQTGIHYPIALPNLQAYKYVTQDTSYMKAVKYDKQLLSLPMGDHLTSDDADKVVWAVREFFK
jgi:dTDP-4-amino-4,6-dideoxygalactose transaminase